MNVRAIVTVVRQFLVLSFRLDVTQPVKYSLWKQSRVGAMSLVLGAQRFNMTKQNGIAYEEKRIQIPD